jgi:hypothetical protein
MRIGFFVSGHGLGHAGRAVPIIDAICQLSFDFMVTVVSSVPARFFESSLAHEVAIVPESIDIGCCSSSDSHGARYSQCR